MAQRVIPVTHLAIHNQIQETPSIFLANTDPTHWHSLRLSVLPSGARYCLCIALLQTRDFSGLSRSPVSKHHFSPISSLQSAMPCNAVFAEFSLMFLSLGANILTWALALKTCPLGLIPGGKSSSSWSPWEFCYRLQWPCNPLMWAIQQYGEVQWEVNPDCQLYTLLGMTEIINSKLHKPISIWLSPKYCEVCI